MTAIEAGRLGDVDFLPADEEPGYREQWQQNRPVFKPKHRPDLSRCIIVTLFIIAVGVRLNHYMTLHVCTLYMAVGMRLHHRLTLQGGCICCCNGVLKGQPAWGGRQELVSGRSCPDRECSTSQGLQYLIKQEL